MLTIQEMKILSLFCAILLLQEPIASVAFLAPRPTNVARDSSSSTTQGTGRSWIRLQVLQEPTQQQQQQQQQQAQQQSDQDQQKMIMRNDIEVMRQEARRRLDALSIQMEQLKTTNAESRRRASESGTHHHQSSNPGTATTATTTPSRHRRGDELSQSAMENNKISHYTSSSSSSLDSLEGDMTTQPPLLVDDDYDEEEESLGVRGDASRHHSSNNNNNKNIQHSAAAVHTSESASSSLATASPRLPSPVSLDLLDNTRWKIAFNVGRERGTWMPKEWGQSGDRVVFQVLVDFTDQTVYDRDDFFQGVAGTKRLNVLEAWLLPRGVGQASIGRRSLAVKPTGAYKVARGQGPLGTDVLRLYIELEQEVRLDPNSDVYCPAGRTYGTCGYFGIHHSTDANPNGLAASSSLYQSNSLKDELAKQYNAALVKYEQLQTELESDTRFFSVDQIKLMKQIWNMKDQITLLEKRLLEARQREPDKVQLRLSRRGDVGLSKEGGVCCKIQKGLALEYRILGRMELGCVESHHQNHHHHDAHSSKQENMQQQKE